MTVMATTPCSAAPAGTTSGRPGNDTLLGEAGKDWLFGEAGKDLCVGGPGKDIDRVAHRHQGRADRPDSFFMPVPWKCEVKKSI